MCEQAENVAEVERSILLVEYQAAQASAEHHDNLVWVVTGIIWAASLVLLGVALDHAVKPALSLLLAALSLFAILLHCFLGGFQSQLRTIKNQKYARCKAIEDRLKYMSQHTSTIHAADSQSSWYVIVQVLFIVGWFSLGIFALCHRAG